MTSRLEQAAMPELWILYDVTGRDHVRGRNTGGAQGIGELRRGLVERPRAHVIVDEIVGRGPALVAGELVHGGPWRIAELASQRSPLRAVLDRDRHPAVVAGAPVDPLRCGTA